MQVKTEKANVKHLNTTEPVDSKRISAPFYCVIFISISYIFLLFTDLFKARPELFSIIFFFNIYTIYLFIPVDSLIQRHITQDILILALVDLIDKSFISIDITDYKVCLIIVYVIYNLLCLKKWARLEKMINH